MRLGTSPKPIPELCEVCGILGGLGGLGDLLGLRICTYIYRVYTLLKAAYDTSTPRSHDTNLVVVDSFYCLSFSSIKKTGVLAASIEVIGIPKRVLTSPDLAAYVMSEGDDGEEGGRAEARNEKNKMLSLWCLPSRRIGPQLRSSLWCLPHADARRCETLRML